MNVKRNVADIGTGLFLSLLKLLAKRIVSRFKQGRKKEEIKGVEITPMTPEEQESYNKAKNRASVSASVQSHHDNK